MKILLTTPFVLDPNVGGPAHTVVTTGLKLIAAGVDTRIVSGDRKRFPPPGPAASLRDVGRVDVVHNFGLWTPFSHAVSTAAALTRTPYVLGTLGMLEPWALTQSTGRKRLAMLLYQRRNLERAAALHATSLAEVQNIRALGIKAPIALIPHGMDVPAQREDQEEEIAPHELRTALFLSRIHPKKGLLDLVEAWAKLRPEGWRIIVAGPDEKGHRAEVEAVVERLELRRCVSFAGAVDHAEKQRLMRTADLFVLPTYSENFGLVVPEALVHGTPVLTTTGTPWSELIETDSGWWIEPGANSLATALATILPLSRTQLRAMGANGRRLVTERYAWSVIAQMHIDLYGWIADGAAKPAFVHG